MTRDRLYHHQQLTVDFLIKNNRAFVSSTAGTGKTVCIIRDVDQRLNANLDSKTLILAPKSLLDTVWRREFALWAPHIRTSVAVAPDKKRLAAFNTPANVYITNIDALVWLRKRPDSFWDNFETIIIDESTSIKNDSSRSKAARVIKKWFKYRRCLSGTPTAGPLTDLFYQYNFLDDGATLGASFTRFRNQVMIATQTGPHPKMVTWGNKPGREAVLAKLLQHMTIRFELENVVDMPPVVEYTYKYKLNDKSKKIYHDMKTKSKIDLDTGIVTALNASTTTNKLLQIASGVVYNSDTGEDHLVDTQRYELVLDICDQVKHSVVFFRWKAQRKYFIEQAEARGIPITYIDGTVSSKERELRVADFQKGEYKIIFLQPQSSAHGITLTKASQTIWASPIYLGDYYSQGNNRVFRLGQTKRTTVINIEAEHTLDNIVYDKLKGKLTAMELLTEVLS